MSKKRQKSPQRGNNDKRDEKNSAKSTNQTPAPCEPVSIVNGIPDRSENCSLWQYLALGLVFAGWIAFLVYCQLAATPN